MAKLFKNLMGDGSRIDISCINIPTLTVGGKNGDNEEVAKAALANAQPTRVNAFGYFQDGSMGFVICMVTSSKSIITGLLYRHGWLVRRFEINSGVYKETLIRES